MSTETTKLFRDDDLAGQLMSLKGEVATTALDIAAENVGITPYVMYVGLARAALSPLGSNVLNASELFINPPFIWTMALGPEEVVRHHDDLLMRNTFDNRLPIRETFGKGYAVCVSVCSTEHGNANYVMNATQEKRAELAVGLVLAEFLGLLTPQEALERMNARQVYGMGIGKWFPDIRRRLLEVPEAV